MISGAMVIQLAMIIHVVGTDAATTSFLDIGFFFLRIDNSCSSFQKASIASIPFLPNHG